MRQQSKLDFGAKLVPNFDHENQVQEASPVAEDQVGSQKWQAHDHGGLPDQWSRREEVFRDQG